MNKKLVFAHLLTWFQTKDHSNKWRMWESAYEGSVHDPDRILDNGLRDIASLSYPTIGVYDSNDPKVIEYQLLTMKLAGIDGVIIDWDGRRINRYRHLGMMNVLPMLEKFNMKLMVCFEEWCGYWPISKGESRSTQLKRAIESIKWLYDAVITKTNYPKIDNKYPLLVFRKIPSHWFTSDEWEYIKEETKDLNISYLFNDVYDETFHEVSDGYFTWVSGFDAETSTNTLDFYEREFKNYVATKTKHAKDKIFIGSVMPGFDDSPVNGWGDGSRKAPRYHKRRYRLSWENMKRNDVDIVQIVTWNDWNEGSQIEPCDKYGYDYIYETFKQIESFKGKSRAVPIDAVTLPLELYKLRNELGSNQRLEDLSEALNELDHKKAKKIIQLIKGGKNET